jgi:hypothetical protein
MSEYKDALGAFDEWARNMPESPFKSEIDLASHIGSVRRALLIADALEKEPSEGMLEAGAGMQGYGDDSDPEDIFKAMVAKMKEEIGINHV